MNHRAVVLASGGLDSTVTAAIAKQEKCECRQTEHAPGHDVGVLFGPHGRPPHSASRCWVASVETIAMVVP